MVNNSDTTYDAIILGAGPNGLTCGAYLAKAGAKVLILEHNPECGGGLVTQELSGFKMNSHATYMLLGDLMPAYTDLDLADYGVKFITPDVQASFLYDDGNELVLYEDDERTESVIADNFSQRDAQAFRKMYDDFSAACSQFIIPATYAPPLSPIDQVVLLEQTDEIGRKISAMSEMTPKELVESYDFSDSRLAASFTYLASMFGLDPTGGGMGFLAPIYVWRLMKNQLVKGGSHQLASSLRRVIEQYGGTIITNATVTSIEITSGEATGVVLREGTEYKGRAIVSTLNPEQTFLRLIDPKYVPGYLKEASTSWEWDETSLFVSNFGIVGEPPVYDRYDPDVSRSLVVVMGVNSADELIEHYENISNGELPSDIIGHASCLSQFDQLMAPSHLPEYGNCESLRFECWAPYDQKWDEIKVELSRKILEFWSKYAPNLKDANVRINLNWSPWDIEDHLPTMKRGAIKHGAYITLQMGSNRPNTDCSNYRTPIAGLYVAGASVHPGGMVILGSGYNAAGVVCKDLNLKRWWPVPPMVNQAVEKGYLTLED